jgi:hypothetical protein
VIYSTFEDLIQIRQEVTASVPQEKILLAESRLEIERLESFSEKKAKSTQKD